MIFAFFLMAISILAGILAGAVIHNLSKTKTSNGVAWTGLVIALTLALMTSVMGSHLMLNGPPPNKVIKTTLVAS